MTELDELSQRIAALVMSELSLSDVLVIDGKRYRVDGRAVSRPGTLHLIAQAVALGLRRAGPYGARDAIADDISQRDADRREKCADSYGWSGGRA